jgi:mercuric ion transport protein
MRAALLAGGGLLAALAASTCCVLPLSLAAAGIGGAWLSTLTALAPYETVFRALAVLLLAAGFWLVYARRPAAADGATCKTVPWRRLTTSLLWAGAIVLALVLSSGWWGQLTA